MDYSPARILPAPVTLERMGKQHWRVCIDAVPMAVIFGRGAKHRARDIAERTARNLAVPLHRYQQQLTA